MMVFIRAVLGHAQDLIQWPSPQWATGLKKYLLVIIVSSFVFFVYFSG